MYGLYSHDKENDKSDDETDFGGVRPLLENYTTDSIVYHCVSINFIDSWLNVLKIILSGIVLPIKRRRKKYLNRFLLK